MLMIEEKKDEFIKKLNQNFRTILSYGNDGLIPMGEFVINDIQEDEIPTEYSNGMSDFQFCNVILTKVDDENVQIVLPMTTFLREYSDAATKNADRLALGSDLSLSVEDVERIAEEKVLNDETLQELLEAETISLDESGAEYIINGEVQSSNYSICPVNLGKYRERIKEKRTYKEDSKGKTTLTNNYRQEGGIEHSLYNESDYER